jgi:TolB protein
VAATNIEWSPDGKAIQAQSGVANTDLYLVNADGSNLRNLTNDRGRDFLGSWASVSAGASTSPASAPRPLTSTVSLADDDIVYQSLSVLTDPSTGRVALIRSDGSHDRRLFNVELPEGCPVASPDRRLVAFLSLGLWVAAVDGSVERQIADTATATFGCAAWSPDGKYLAWINRRGGSVDPFQLWVAALDGSPPRVVAGSQGMYGITWAANSQSLWYADAPPGFPRQLMRVSISGGPTVFGAADWSFPSQRSDGRIAVGCGGMICTAGPNGESPQTLVAGSEPFWSPDGTHIGFFREEDINTDRGELYWMNADGSSVHQLTSIDEHPAWMSWSPKGDAISFIAHKAVNVVRLAGPSWSVITSGHWGDMTSWGSNSVPILF